MFKLFLFFLIGTVTSSLIWAGMWWKFSQKELLSPESQNTNVVARDKPLEKFKFINLAQTEFKPDKIEIGEQVEKTTQYTSHKFIYYWEGRKISGLVNIPTQGTSPYPTIIMIRGYAEQQFYQSGMGTRNAGRYFAQNGFLTISPDFLGFADSDPPENDVWWERFSKPSQVLQLIASLRSLTQVDINRIGIWGHSNGGQISLSILEITRKSYPTSLWAPVSSPFPYGVLYFTDTDDDEGQALRFRLANLEWDYDVREFSITQYFNMINAPINLHQGGQDTDVPVYWSNRLEKKLKEAGNEINYYFYPQSDHNMRPDWNVAVNRDVNFYKKYLLETSIDTQ